MLICVIASAYLEGDRIITCALQQHVNAYRRRAFELNGSARPFSLRHPNDLDSGLSTSYASPTDAGVPNGATADNGSDIFDHNDRDESDSGTSAEKSKPLLYRLIMLFYYLITRRLWAMRSGQGSAASNVNAGHQIPTARFVAGDRSVRSTVSMPASKGHETSGNHQHHHHQSEPKSRRSSSGQSSNVHESGNHTANRKSSEDHSNQYATGVTKRPSPSQTPPTQNQSPTSNDRKTSASKAAKKRTVPAAIPTATVTPPSGQSRSMETPPPGQKNGKENAVVKEEVVRRNFAEDHLELFSAIFMSF